MITTLLVVTIFGTILLWWGSVIKEKEYQPISDVGDYDEEMNGLRFVKTGQYGRLYILSNLDEYSICVLPENTVVNSTIEAQTSGGVLVYARIYDECGYIYDEKWFHKGKWRDDALLVIAEETSRIKQAQEKTAQRDLERKKEELDLLSKY